MSGDTFPPNLVVTDPDGTARRLTDEAGFLIVGNDSPPLSSTSGDSVVERAFAEMRSTLELGKAAYNMRGTDAPVRVGSWDLATLFDRVAAIWQSFKDALLAYGAPMAFAVIVALLSALALSIVLD